MFFFNVLCGKVIDVSKLDDIQSQIVTTLCMLEKYFLPSFFDIMVHLTVHLVREVKLCGPVWYRWMYPFERYMRVLKSYVRNRNRPEGCMAECYIAEEAVEFCSEYLSLRMLYIYGKRSGNSHITIELDDNVFGVKHNLYVDMEDIVPFCELKPISYMCIATYVCFLQSKLNMLPWADMVRFVDPLNIGYIPTTKKDAETANEHMEFRARELSKRLIDTKSNQIFLAPCNVKYHWILTVIDPNKGEIAILDSLYKGIHDKIWKEVVELALRLFNMEKRKKGKKKPDWTILKVPKQPDLTQCGFYVMKYMREIVINSHPWTIGSLQSLFNAHEKYSNEEIDVVRAEWADCVQEYIKE
ncbi:uncharacterized protein LOC131018047 [Salvia miltiorrhiza]|uniref:uncharacterized protein LOC131018047 n=1 Tax=Salvia miltiorrhiza TaxID=226208 RepID=UPI0025AD73CA|nr:uncharacterized protein LOC131018047 [Salvia miltiorrhiza]